MSRDAYLRRVRGAESPTGADNRAGSGAYSHFQFMPATAAGLAKRTTWGAGLSPDNLKAIIKADSNKAQQLADLYTGDSDGALKGAGLEVNDVNRFALHRFGQGGGVSLLRADANMPVADWARSVQWGPGVSHEAVIKQNGLGGYTNVGDLRTRFIANQIGGTPAPAEPVPVEPAAPAPAEPLVAAFTPRQLPLEDPFGAMFADTGQPRAKPNRARRQAIFGDF